MLNLVNNSSLAIIAEKAQGVSDVRVAGEGTLSQQVTAVAVKKQQERDWH
jgi:hypothetical protein